MTHWWTDQLRTNLEYAITRYHLPGSLAFSTAQSQRTQNAYVNLIWSPVKSVNIGLEFAWGQRQQRPDATGHEKENQVKRLQASLQYVF